MCRTKRLLISVSFVVTLFLLEILFVSSTGPIVFRILVVTLLAAPTVFFLLSAFFAEKYEFYDHYFKVYRGTDRKRARYDQVEDYSFVPCKYVKNKQMKPDSFILSTPEKVFQIIDNPRNKMGVVLNDWLLSKVISESKIYVRNESCRKLFLHLYREHWFSAWRSVFECQDKMTQMGYDYDSRVLRSCLFRLLNSGILIHNASTFRNSQFKQRDPPTGNI